MRNRAWALSQMVKTKQPEDEVKAMRERLVHEGWTKRDDLPPGWMVKAGKHSLVDFMTPVGKQFNSLNRARALMEKFGECNFDFSRLKKNLLNPKKTNSHKEKSGSQQEAKTNNASQLLKEISVSAQDLVNTEEREVDLTKVTEESTTNLEHGGNHSTKLGDFDLKDFDDNKKTIGVEMVAGILDNVDQVMEEMKVDNEATKVVKVDKILGEYAHLFPDLNMMSIN